jgi:SAM-dependent methyltransferase
MTKQPSRTEPVAVAERYARRVDDDRYSPLKPDVRMTLAERQRAMLRLFTRRGWHDLSRLRLLEVGSGSGTNLLELLRLGFGPEHLTGVELLAARHAAARAALPPAVTLVEGDATALQLPAASHDIVLVSTVFSSLLDDAFQQRLAERIWHWTRPGGGVLWYDFTVDNPRNPDVRGVPLRRIRELFPEASVEAERVTLAPPIARVVSRWHPSLYTLLNSLPMLRTHVLAWLAKT